MAAEPSIGLSVTDVQVALEKCLTLNDIERKRAFDYLSECENNNSFLLVLLECFITNSRTENNVKLQSLIYLKNAISRKWGAGTSRHLFKSTVAAGTNNA